ncbi:MAG: FAD-dependent oxidoreductase, partial [Opitutaceae bacterium]|nr:FAD-dependent oxidoreductase [Opitutaceae bacterium]
MRVTGPVFYQIPWRSLPSRSGYGNFVVTGRMPDADPVAYGAVRVMVNLDQTGEAAGVAAALALERFRPVTPSAPLSCRRAAFEDFGVRLRREGDGTEAGREKEFFVQAEALGVRGEARGGGGAGSPAVPTTQAPAVTMARVHSVTSSVTGA